MTANTVHRFCQPKAVAFLSAAISATATTCYVEPGGAQRFINAVNNQTGAVYATLTDPTKAIEIVKITAISGNTFTIARSQEGTSNVAWPAGSVLVQRLTAGNLDTFFQKGSNRSIAYNPNGILSANYPGEEIYQSNIYDCEMRWWKNVGGTTWALIAGELCDWGDDVEFFEPDAADGYLFTFEAYASGWAATVARAAADVAYDSDIIGNPTIWAGVNGTDWYYLNRSYLYFDLSAIGGPGSTIIDAMLTVFGRNCSESPNAQQVNVYEGTQTDPLAVGDFDEFEADLFCTLDYGLGDFSYIGQGALAGTQYVTSDSFSAAGLAYLQSVADASGVAMFCLRDYYYDVLGNVPTIGYDAYFTHYFADESTVAWRPRLMIEYTT